MAGDFFIAKVFRQRNSLVVVIPQELCIAMNIKTKQYLVMSWNNQDGSFTVTKFKPIGEKDGSDKTNKSE